jgi:hypothetical protein
MQKPNAQELLRRFAATISKQPLGLVTHAPEPWADPMQCVGNVLQKVSRDGGRAAFGWAFLDRRSLEYGDYLIAQHHAVWCAAGSTVAVDITPFHENPRHRPYSPGGSVLFLLDDAAQPRIIGQVVAPLASRFFPATNDPKLAAYIETLRGKEQAECQEVYDSALAAQPGLERPH